MFKSNPIQRFLDDPRRVKSPLGDFKIKETLIQNINKDIDWRGTRLYIDKNIETLKIRASLFTHSFLTINNSLVKNPTPDKRLITFQFKHINQQWSGLTNLRLIGSEESLTKRIGAGQTGIFWDSTTDVGGKLTSQGESHRIKIQGFFKGLNTGTLLSNSTEHNKRKTSNTEHEFDLEGIGCKTLIAFHDGAGAGSNLTFRYQNRQVLLRGEEETELVTLNSDFITVNNPKLYDPNIGKKFRKRLGIEVIGHKYMLTNYKQHNILQNYNWDWYPMDEKVKLIRK